MKSQRDIKLEKAREKSRKRFDPFRLISDGEFVSNLNAIIAYYQILKGRDSGRFVSSSNYDGFRHNELVEELTESVA